MKKLVFVTKNKHKVKEIGAILSKFNVKLIQKELELEEDPSLSLKEVALSKAKQAYKKFGIPLIAEDTGIYFTALKNFPGSKSKRIFEEIGYKGLMEKLKGRKRNALFKTVICFIWGKEEYKLFEGKFEGRITNEPKFLNKDVLPYERIFIPKGKKRLMAALSRKEKNKFSHRAIAAGKLGEFLKTKEFE